MAGEFIGLTFKEEDYINGITEVLRLHILPKPFLLVFGGGVDFVEESAIPALRHSEGLQEVFNLIAVHTAGVLSILLRNPCQTLLFREERKAIVEHFVPINLYAGVRAVVETDEVSIGCSPRIFALAERNEPFLALVVVIEKFSQSFGSKDAG